MILSTEKFPLNKIDNTPTFTVIFPHVTIFTMLGAIRTSQDGMAEELLENIIVELMKRGTFIVFSVESMH